MVAIAATPRNCSCASTGRVPMNGSRNPSSAPPESGAETLRAAGGVPVAAALTLVIVDAGLVAPGRAAGAGLAAPKRLNQSPNDDFGFTACAFAIFFASLVLRSTRPLRETAPPLRARASPAPS